MDPLARAGAGPGLPGTGKGERCTTEGTGEPGTKGDPRWTDGISDTAPEAKLPTGEGDLNPAVIEGETLRPAKLANWPEFMLGACPKPGLTMTGLPG